MFHVRGLQTPQSPFATLVQTLERLGHALVALVCLREFNQSTYAAQPSILGKLKASSKKRSNETSPPPPVRRTDPYQAPYFFPTPRSPEAVDYARRVRLERRTLPSPPTAGSESPPSLSPRKVTISPLPSPTRQTALLPDVVLVSSSIGSPTSSNQDTQSPVSHDDISRPAEYVQRRRRSWHINFAHPSTNVPLRQPSGSWESEGSSSHSGPSRNSSPAKRPSLKKIFRYIYI